jgi:preprotein translocase subunit SecE
VSSDSGSGVTATFDEPTSEPAAAAGGKGAKKPPKDRRGLGRIPRLYREVAAEMRKVIWPTRRELLAYSSVVLVFVTAMVLLVAGLDFAFAKGVLKVFG